jgi:hydroxyacylglutathione hydrolase
MYVQQLYTASLSVSSYYFESNGEAAIIDPLRDVQPYIDLARERNATIKYIFETHLHADFVSGHIELSGLTAAPIVYGPYAETNYDIIVANDKQNFIVGDLKVTVLHTPGHTIESCAYLLHDEKGAPYCIFTGDSLFAGDVGQPDMSSGDLGSEELAAMLFHSTG